MEKTEILLISYTGPENNMFFIFKNVTLKFFSVKVDYGPWL